MKMTTTHGVEVLYAEIDKTEKYQNFFRTRSALYEQCDIPQAYNRKRDEWVARMLWGIYAPQARYNPLTADGDVVVYRRRVNRGTSKYPDWRFDCDIAIARPGSRNGLIYVGWGVEVSADNVIYF